MSRVTVEVDLGARRYPIHIGAGLLADAACWRAALRGRQVLVVSDEHVAPLYLQHLRAGLGGFAHAALVLPAGEPHKTLAASERIFDALAALGAHRDAALIALGGGVIGDLTGFAAACWMRGIDFVQMPTTLLAMVDSSVGGKTGVNLAAGKNLVGAFHQPVAVIADTDTLATLPEREYRAGLAEVVKIAAVADGAFFNRLEEEAEALLAHDRDAIAAAVAASCRLKAAIVARDEREQGDRALLNFGHTFGHALEAVTGYTALLHGEAVAIGMVLAARFATQLGHAAQNDADRLEALLARFGLPTRLPPCDLDAVLERMRLDKKNLSGRLRLILWRGIGLGDIADGIDEAAVAAFLRHSDCR